jgi:hypothetical protein
MGKSLQAPAGPLWGDDVLDDDDIANGQDKSYIPQVSLHHGDGRRQKRVLMLCTGGTLTMAPDPAQGGALAPVEGALSSYLQEMNELKFPARSYTAHLVDSSISGQLGRLAQDIRANHLYFDFVCYRNRHHGVRRYGTRVHARKSR